MAVSARLDKLWAWTTRCIPGFSTVFLVLLTFFALTDLDPLRSRKPGWFTPDESSTAPSHAQFIFLAYALLLHVAALMFPIRLCGACHWVTKEIEAVHARLARGLPFKSAQPQDPVEGSGGELTGVAPGVPTPEIIQCLMIPSYKEEIDILEDTLNVLASHPDAKASYHVVMAMEARDPNAESTAKKLLASYESKFRLIEYTVHPGDIPGEAVGKSSNVSWAANHLRKFYSGSPHWKNVLVTVMDCDTHLSADYFTSIRSIHATKRGAMTLYAPPIIFDRNARDVPVLVRVADMMWSGACLSMFGKGSSVIIPTAVYTLSLTTVDYVGGWDTGPEAIGEDMHMMLKCYFATNGKLHTHMVPSPASQCNVGGKCKGLRGWVAAIRARYAQGLRHMWGSLDTGFAVRQWSKMGQPKERNPSYSSRPRKLSETDLDLKLSQMDIPSPRRYKLSYRNMILFCRMFEAHLLPTHLVIVLLASAIYSNLTPVAAQPPMVVFAMSVMAGLRTLSFFIMLFYFVIFYERYHDACVTSREAAMKRAGLYDGMVDSFAHRSHSDWRTWPDYFIFPVAGMLLGSLPAMQATFSHFFTNRLVYVVSEKPRNARSPLATPLVEPAAV